MKFQIRKISTMLIVLSIIFTGCSTKGSEEAKYVNEKKSLWVVTERITGQNWIDRIENAVSNFEKNNEEVKIYLDVLPTNEEERTVKLEQIRVEIMAGKGPDIYLLPVGLAISDPLFEDVSQAMHNGLFYDISEFYDTDEELEKDRLVTAVMDAGCIENSRYILPLRYDFPALYVDMENLENTPIDKEILNGSISDIMDAVIATAENSLACGVEFNHLLFGLNMYPELFDYESDTVFLQSDDMVNYMQRYQTLWEVIGDTSSHRAYFDIPSYIQSDKSWVDLGFSIYADCLSDCLDLVAIAKAEGRQVSMVPIRGIDGSLIADIVYWGAVGADTVHPEMAYNFLRMFLQEEYQWMLNYDGNNMLKIATNVEGWPVRTNGSVEALWEIYRSQISETIYESESQGWTKRKSVVMQVKLTDSDIVLPQEEINCARFSIPEEYTEYYQSLCLLNDSRNSYTATDVDIKVLAEKVVQSLWWHVAEG